MYRILRNRLHRLRVVTSPFLVAIIVGCGTSLFAQSSFPSLPQPARPVPIETSNSYRATTSPMSIGPAPGLYPPLQGSVPYGQMIIGFDGRPVYLAPPVFVPPAYGVRGFGPPVRVDSANSSFFPPDRSVPHIANAVPHEIMAPVATEMRRESGTANLRLRISETFLNRVIEQERIEPGPVRDHILGAEVTGRQTTVSRVRLDLKPASDKGVATFVLNGNVQTLTTGVTPQAMIDTAGRQQFLATKEVYFDGIQFSTRHAMVFIRAQNQTIGATTPLSGTLFGGIANRIAYAAAERQKSAGEAVARDRLAEKLFPTFDGEVDARLSQANRQLEPVRKRLDAVQLLPKSQSVWTSETHLFHEMQIGNSPSPISPPVTEGAAGREGISLSIHESLLNTLVDRAGLKGLKTTDKQLRELQEQFLSATGNATVDQDPLESAEPQGIGTLKPPFASANGNFVTEIEFDDVEPLVMKLERDQLVVTIKAHFKPAGQAVIPPMVVTIPYRTELAGSKLRWVAGKPQVLAQDRPDPAAPQTIVESTIQQIIEGDLTPLEFERTLPAALWPGSGPPPGIAALKSDSGWVTIAIE